MQNPLDFSTVSMWLCEESRYRQKYYRRQSRRFNVHRPWERNDELICSLL